MNELDHNGIKGLVLAGGKSERMEFDKGALEYHGVSQRRFVYQQFQQLGMEGFVSCRKDQVADIEEELPLILDTLEELGPMGALLSAFRQDPYSAWLIIACDLPYLSLDTIKQLLKNRDTSKLATAFRSPFIEFPEPLITIWEPRSYPVIQRFLKLGYKSLSKVLINSDIKMIQAKNTKELRNINNPDEYQAAVADLKAYI